MAIVGIDIGGTKVAVCAAEAAGTVLARTQEPSRTEEGPGPFFDRVLDMIGRVRSEAGLEWEAVEAMGVSAPGPLSVSRGCLLNPPNMVGWGEVDVAGPLADACPCPVYINNDANACASAEYRFGAHSGEDPLLYLTMSTGLGAGIVVHGRVLQGACDQAGEVGYHVLDPDGPASPAGHPGSFEAFCGGKNVADRLRRRIVEEGIDTSILAHAGGDPEAIRFEAFLAAAREGDAFAAAEWAAYIEHLAQGMGNLINIINPSILLLGTIARHAGDFLFDPLRARLPAYAIPQALEACRIEVASLLGHIGDLSAVATALDGMDGNLSG